MARYDSERWAPKRERFCQEYLVDANQTQAAIRAGFSPKTARQIASILMAMPEIRARVQGLMDARAEKVALSAEWVIGQLMSVVADARREGKLLEAIKGCELLGKHLTMFSERHEHTGKDGGPITVTVVRQIVRPGDRN